MLYVLDRACALLSEELKGVYTDPVSFRTIMCEPDRPQPPKLSSKTKTSLSLKWNVSFSVYIFKNSQTISLLHWKISGNFLFSQLFLSSVSMGIYHN